MAEFRPPGCRVVVVDDGSPGGVVRRTAEQFGRVEVVRRESPGGFAVAANLGIAATDSDIVELLNDDAVVTAGWADPALRAFADPSVGSVAPLVLRLDGDPGAVATAKIDSAGDEYDSGGFAAKRATGRAVAGAGLVSGPVWGASASAAFYRRSALDEVGRFPECFGAYFEDVDLAHRLNRAKWRCHFEAESVVWHAVSASYGQSPPRHTLRMQSRNEERVYWRNAASARTLPRHAAVLAGKALRRLREGALAPWLLGRLDAWTALRPSDPNPRSAPGITCPTQRPAGAVA